MNTEQKLEQWAEQALAHALEKTILPDNSNGYVAFGRYHIRPSRAGVTVSTWADDIHCFINKRHAMTWCILDHRGNYGMANRIVALDKRKQTLNSDIHTRQSIAERIRDANSRETVEIKLSTKIQSLTAVNHELDKCIGYAKYLQTKGFTNETARTSRA
jgi:hypothetical protein